MILHRCWCGDNHPKGRKHPRPRPTSAARGYDHGWRMLRAQVLGEEPDCRVCGQPATDVDHIVPRRRGGSDDRENLQPLCHAHHSAKTLRGL